MLEPPATRSASEQLNIIGTTAWHKTHEIHFILRYTII